jgi:UDP-N-acetylmuramoyl-tripeptide--D-alanyl-D-alanine ligase
MSPLTLQQLIDAVRGQAVGALKRDAWVDRIETDSRKIRRGDLFWALKGESQDGHTFIGDAADRGAIACVADKNKLKGASLPAIAVEDSLKALWAFSAWYRNQFEPFMVGVTGSVGKTTTRHLLHTVLSTRFPGTQSLQNYNNHVGLPLSVLSLSRNHEFAVFELGASRLGEIAPLARIIRPEVGVITAIAPTHLDQFGSLDNIRKTKGELLDCLPPTGFAVLNGDDPQLRQLGGRAQCRVIWVGEQENNDLVARDVIVDDGLVRFLIDDSEFILPAVGRHHLGAALVSVAVGREIDMSDDEIASGFNNFEAVPGRCRLMSVGDWLVIDDTYNASPASMAAACQTLSDWNQARKRLLVLGDMLCLGQESQKFHRELGERVGASRVDHVALIGPESNTVAASVRSHGFDAGCLGVCHDLNTLTMLLDCWLEPGDVVLIKGSRGMQMERVIAALQQIAARNTKVFAHRAAA